MTNEERLYVEDDRGLKHSGLGIASFIIAIVLGVFEFLFIVVAGIVETTNSGGIEAKPTIAIVVGMSILLGVGLSLVGIGLGIAGLIQKNRKKVFTILGLVFNIAVIIMVLGIVVIGIIVS
jgi:hypothetical protein